MPRLRATSKSVHANLSTRPCILTAASYSDGRVSYFTQQGAYGSCGQIHEDEEHVVAISYKLQGLSYPPPFCGHKVQITHEGAERHADGRPKDKVVKATVGDTCTTCDSAHLELSVAAYEALTGCKHDDPEPAALGRISWKLL